MSTQEVTADAGVETSVDTPMEVRRAIGVLFSPGDVVEVRVPKTGRSRTISGYFEDREELARAVERMEDADYKGVYWTANPVNPALLARADHKLKSFVENTTTDGDIIRRRWLLVDLDPKRPAGISSSNAEHSAALDLARWMRDELYSEGWSLSPALRSAVLSNSSPRRSTRSGHPMGTARAIFPGNAFSPAV